MPRQLFVVHRVPRWSPLVLSLLLTTLCAPRAMAWEPSSVRQIAFEAARLAPPDLYRQLVRNRSAFAQGIAEPPSTSKRSDFEKNADGSGELDRLIARRTAEAIESIRQHRPFNEVAYRLGLVSHYLVRANDPLATDRTDPEESRFAADYRRYVASAEPRVRRVFYGFPAGPADASGHVDRLVADALGRGRALYPLIGREYRRVAFATGVRSFDDRSTAYAVAALSYNHAVSDVAGALRYIWVAAGGSDPRVDLPVRGRRAVRFSTDGAPSVTLGGR